jgi:hypothetical protein
VLVTSDAIESGERIRLRVCDSDRFSSDDALGIVELDLADLADEASRTPHLIRRTDELRADRPGMRAQGVLHWSVRFCGLWQLPEEEIRRRSAEAKAKKGKGEPSEVEAREPWWLGAVRRWVGDPPGWEEQRKDRRKETLEWFTGEKARDEMEAAEKPSEERRSGVLQVSSYVTGQK